MIFEYEAVPKESNLVDSLLESSSGITIKISEHEKLEGLVSLQDGFYLVKGTKQIIEKRGNELDVFLIDGETSFVNELNVSFFY